MEKNEQILGIQYTIDSQSGKKNGKVVPDDWVEEMSGL